MDTKKFQRATEIMNELKKLHDSVEDLKKSHSMCFYTPRIADKKIEEWFYDKSQIFIACRDLAISECEERIAQLEKEFNNL